MDARPADRQYRGVRRRLLWSLVAVASAAYLSVAIWALNARPVNVTTLVWMFVAVPPMVSAALLIIVLDNPLFIALMAAGAIVGLSLGILLITRASVDVVRWSILAGVAWLIAFGGMTLTQLNKPIGQLFSVLWLTGFGVAGAVVAYRRREEASA
jgi:hypothetical protein